MSEEIVPQEWEERAFEKAEFGVLRTYVNKHTGEIRFNLNDVARCLGMSVDEAKEDYSAFNFSRNSYGVSYDLCIGNNIVRGEFQNI